MSEATSETSNRELIDKIRRHVKRLRRRPAEDLSHETLLEIVADLEKLTGPIPGREGELDFVDQWRAEAEQLGIPLPRGRCALSDDGYHRFLQGQCTICGEPEPMTEST